MGVKGKLIYGVGTNDYDKEVCKNGKIVPEYEMWRGLLKRVYCIKTKVRKPSYVGNSVDSKWHSMSAFIDDVSTLIGYEQAISNGWHLDKDILGNGNKHYSKNTCCFVPREINIVVANKATLSTQLPLGVRKRPEKDSFVARLGTCDGRIYLGDFSTAEQAFLAYKQAKESYIKEIANKWKDQIDPRVYEALMSWNIISLT